MMDLNPADIILVKGWRRIVTWFLNLLQKDKVKYGHVAIVVYGRYIVEADFKIRKLSFEKFFKKHKHYKVIRLRSLTQEDAYNLITKIEEKLHKTYGWSRFFLQIFDNIFCTNWFTQLDRNNSTQICSSLVAYAYYRVLGINFNSVDWASCEPDDIDDESQNLPQFWQTWEK